MIRRMFAIGCAAAAFVLPDATAQAQAVDSAQAPQSGPLIIHVPEAKHEAKTPPKKPEPQKKAEAVKPPTAHAPATPNLRAPAHTKPNNKIWI